MPVEPQKKATPKKAATKRSTDESAPSPSATSAEAVNDSRTQSQEDSSSAQSHQKTSAEAVNDRATGNDSPSAGQAGKPHAGAGTHTDETTPEQNPLGRENPQDSAVVNHPVDPLHPEDPGVLPASPFSTSPASPLDRNVPRTVATSDPGALDDFLKRKREQESAVSFAEANRDLVSAASAAPSLLDSALDRAERHERRRENAERMNEKRVKETELLARGTGDATFDSPVNMRRALDQL